MFGLFRAEQNTEQKAYSSSLELQECKAKLDAISQSQAVIEFEMDGTIITANNNFLGALGYRMDEIVGQHHRTFMPYEERESKAYREFWEALNRGDFHSGEFRRIRKDGSDIWIEAMYYPLRNREGKLTKVVKFATDATDKVTMRNRINDLGKRVSESIDHVESMISEISGHVTDAADLASVAQQEVHASAESVRSLDDSSQVIEKVVDLIRSLAEQSNLLALNATIESARAGDAGKGFAVVANEVKELAKQTAGATDNIDGSVSMIRQLVRQNVESTNDVLERINRVTTAMTSISGSVKEQTVAMQSLSNLASQLR